MTMRVVPEAVEPRARAQVYVQHDLDWHRGDNLRGGAGPSICIMRVSSAHESLMSVRITVIINVHFPVSDTIVSTVGTPITDTEGADEHRLGTRQHP